LTDNLETEQLAAAIMQTDALAYPLSPGDIRALLRLLPQDGDAAADLNWSVLHEASPDWPVWDLFDDRNNEWIRVFRLRLANGGFHPAIRSD